MASRLLNASGFNGFVILSRSSDSRSVASPHSKKPTTKYSARCLDQAESQGNDRPSSCPNASVRLPLWFTVNI